MTNEQPSINIATLNVMYLRNADIINQVLLNNNIDVCGMQEVAGIQSMNTLSDIYEKLFDFSYKSYGNGLVYNKHKFKLKSTNVCYIHHPASTYKSKKSIFEVNLQHLASKRIITFYVTHLNHYSESQRLLEWDKALTFIRKRYRQHWDNNRTLVHNHIVLADLNSLTRTDYTDEQWTQICNVRKQNKIEPASTKLTDTYLSDYIDVVPSPLGATCKYNTRIDYILLSKGAAQNIDVLSASVIDTLGASDHNCVISTISFVVNK